MNRRRQNVTIPPILFFLSAFLFATALYVTLVQTPMADLKRPAAAEHAEVFHEHRDAMMIAMVKRLGGKVSISLTEADNVGQDLLHYGIDDQGTVHFEVKRKP